MFACTTENYDLLYARYLEKPGTLLEFAKFKPEMRLLDLCGGTGAISKAAIEMGAATVDLFDLKPRCATASINEIAGDFNKGGAECLKSNYYDMVVCRQAVAYLDLDKLVTVIPRILKPGGRFVFNMFRNPPSVKGRRYKYKDRVYFELSWRMFGRVFHIQKCGKLFDLSIFEIARPEVYISTLLEVFGDGAKWKRHLTDRTVWVMFEKEAIVLQ